MLLGAGPIGGRGSPESTALAPALPFSLLPATTRPAAFSYHNLSQWYFCLAPVNHGLKPLKQSQIQTSLPIVVIRHFPIYRNLTNSDNTHGFLVEDLTMQKQDLGQTSSPCHLRSSSKLTPTVGRIQFLVAVGLRYLFPWQLSTRSYSQFLRTVPIAHHMALPIFKSSAAPQTLAASFSASRPVFL